VRERGLMGNAENTREFSWLEGLAICLSMIGVQLCSEVINQWGLYFYSPSAGVGRTIYVPVYLVGIIFIVGTIWDAFSSPVVGLISDKTPTRPGRWRFPRIQGRRRPYIFWGGILMCFTLTAFWYPPVDGPSLVNLLYGSVLLCAHWTLFSMAVVPLTALGPEIARSERARVAVGTWTAVGMILGLALANALPGVLIAALDPSRVDSGITLVARDGKADVRAALKNLLEQAREVLPGQEVPREAMRVTADGMRAEIAGEAYEIVTRAAGRRAVRALLEGQVSTDSLRYVNRRAWFGVTFPRDADLEAIRRDMARKGAVLVADVPGYVPQEGGALLVETPLAERLDVDAFSLTRGDLLNGWKLKRVEGGILLEPEGGKGTGWSDAMKTALAEGLTEANLVVISDMPGTLACSRALFDTLARAELKAWGSSLPTPVDVTMTTESFSATGYRRVALIFALISLVLFMIPVLVIRERYDSEAVTSEPLPWGQGVVDAFRNGPFLSYAFAFFFFTVGFLAVQRVLPYWAELGLDGDESTITFLLIPFILTAIVFYGVIPLLARRLHMKWMMFLALAVIATGMPFLYIVGKLDVSFTARVYMGMALFAYCGIGQAIIYVMIVPMLGDIIDYDETLSGERREALYNGLSAFIWKASMAGSVLLASQSMSWWGNRIEKYDGVLLVGPFAALFAVVGMVIISLYPRWRDRDSGGVKASES